MMTALLAQITNPALAPALQNAANPQSAANILAKYIAVLWQTAIILGGLAVVVYLLVGGFYWITAGGEKGKIEEAKQRIQQAILGFVILSSVAAISAFLSKSFGIDLLRPTFTNLLGSTAEIQGSNGAGTQGTGVCAGNIPLNGTGNWDDQNGEYCNKKDVATMKCVGPDATFDYVHLEPCRCSSGAKPRSIGNTLVAC